MKKALLAIQVIFLVFFSITLLATILQVSGLSNPFTRFNYSAQAYNQKEDFDPGFSRLNSIETLEDYCDSLYKQQANWSAFPEKTYTDLVSAVIRKRFYHGYSHYGFGDNYVALVASRATVDGYSAIVVPDDTYWSS